METKDRRSPILWKVKTEAAQFCGNQRVFVRLNSLVGVGYLVID